jgi:ERCC4-type nuclease
MNTVTEIIVDHREARSGVLEHLSNLPNIRLRWENLSTGDYIVDGSAIFEGKTAADFADSIDERLFSQAKRLTKLSLRPAFIVEGTAADWKALALRREAQPGALIALTLILDLQYSDPRLQKKPRNCWFMQAASWRVSATKFLDITMANRRENARDDSAY